MKTTNEEKLKADRLTDIVITTTKKGHKFLQRISNDEIELTTKPSTDFMLACETDYFIISRKSNREHARGLDRMLRAIKKQYLDNYNNECKMTIGQFRQLWIDELIGVQKVVWG